MQDSDIRKLLHPYLKKENKKYKDTIIVDEFDLCSGLSRIDVAVVNGVIHGYEIKSEEDTLIRLPNQITYYNKSLEKISIITNKSHLKQIKQLVPNWWGVLIVKSAGKKNIITELRRAKSNPQLDADSLLQILWKDELVSIINKYEIDVSMHLNKRKIRVSIYNSLNVSIISQEVRSALKSRQNWRS
jgi:hypothetical protein